MSKYSEEYWYDFGQEVEAYLVGKRQHFIREDKSEIDAILEAIQSNQKEDYSGVLEKNHSWWIFYHLSDMRTSLLNWYDFKPGTELLEIGGDFGALTGLFCDKCKRVTVTEEKKYRARAIADRYQERENLEVFAGKIDDIEPILHKRFDYIIAVGVLEKRGDGWSDKAPYVKFLKFLLGLLNPEGKIILAVDNRYGIRNFCGARNWHTGKAFDGINRYPKGTKGYEFQRGELTDILDQAGVDRYKFFYPLPDYRVPQLIYTDEYQNASNIAERLEFYDTDQSTLLVAERNLYEDIVNNGELAFLSNSFLIELGKTDTVSDILYAVASTDRGRSNSFTTIIHGDKRVCKKPAFPQGKNRLRAIYNNICTLEKRGISVIPHVISKNQIEMPYVTDMTLSSVLKKFVIKDKERFIDLLDELYINILRASEIADKRTNCFLTSENKAVDFGLILKNAYLDMVPVNCFFINGKLCFFDQEFVLKNCPARFVLYRALKYTYMSMWDMDQYLPISYFKDKYRFSDELWGIFEKEEEKFIASLRNQDVYAQLLDWKKVDEWEIRRHGDQLESVIDTVSYAVNANTDAIRNIELQLLHKFQQVCDKYGLQYYGMYGTMIGAVRHEGFIPWDDDIDIALMRDDYDKLLKVADTEFTEPYFLQTTESDPACFNGGYSKLRNSNTTAIELRNWEQNCNKGICIDIFPLDNCYTDFAENERLRKRILFCQKLILSKIYNISDLFSDFDEQHWMRIANIGKAFTMDYLYDKINQLFRSAPKETGKVAILSRFYWNWKFITYDRGTFDTIKKVKFEALEMSIPVDYMSCLERESVNYEVLPRMEKRKPKHRWCLCAADVPYRVYEMRFIQQRVTLEMKEGDKIVLFGSGELLDDYLYYNKSDYPPELVVDMDQENLGKVQYGYEIQSVDTMDVISEDKQKIIICNRNFRKYEKFLWNKGIYEYHIYIPNKAWATYSEE